MSQKHMVSKRIYPRSRIIFVAIFSGLILYSPLAIACLISATFDSSISGIERIGFDILFNCFAFSLIWTWDDEVMLAVFGVLLDPLDLESVWGDKNRPRKVDFNY